MAEHKADVTLSDGREIVIDLLKISMREYRLIYETGQPLEEGDEIIARCCGMTGEEFVNLPLPDNRSLTNAFFKKARAPLENPT